MNLITPLERPDGSLPDPGERLVDAKRGMVSRRIFFDQSIYRAELEQIFAKCWLYVGHESQLREPGYFVTNYMGEDPVLLTRGASGRIRIFLNSCRHRGMRVCRADVGKTKLFRCSFHGWTYSTDGELVAVPGLEEAYKNKLDRRDWALHEVPRVQNYGGFIFASWNPDAPPLDTFLGDIRWYLDIVLAMPAGRWEAIPGHQRYSLTANWKIAGENFAGDNYHIPFSHGSMWRLDIRSVNPVNYQSSPSLYTVTFANGHGLNGVAVDDERYKADVELARDMGPEVIDYVEDCRRRLAERLSPKQVKVHTFAFGNIFPNFSFNHFSFLRPFGLYLWHPRGPASLEPWQWCLMDSQAPASVKAIIRQDFSRIQAATGIAAQDDTENFEQVTEATRGVIGQRLDFNYEMDIETDAASLVPDFPGRFGNYYSEQGQRNFYAYWAHCMDGKF